MDSFLPLVIVVALFSTILTTQLKPLPSSVNRRVLGTEIAQSDGSSDNEPTDTPSDTDTPLPETPTPTPDVFAPDSPDFATPEATIEDSATPEATPVEYTDPANTAAVVNPDSVINTTQNLTDETINEVKDEESAINNMTDPIAQNQILVDLGGNKVDDMDNLIRQNNWSGVNFTTQRLNDIIDRASENADKVSDNQAVKQQLSDLCQNSDPILRVYALTVPQDLEQDIEIGRGKCLKLQQ